MFSENETYQGYSMFQLLKDDDMALRLQSRQNNWNDHNVMKRTDLERNVVKYVQSRLKMSKGIQKYSLGIHEQK